MERLDYGIELYETDISPRLFITGGIDDVLKYREYALDRGVPAEDIFPKESQALTTYEEALALKQFLDQEQAIHSVMVVSSPYHMRRSQLIFEWLLGNRVKLQFRPVPFERSGHQRRWWADPGSRQSVIGEYLKILGLPFIWIYTEFLSTKLLSYSRLYRSLHLRICKLLTNSSRGVII